MSSAEQKCNICLSLYTDPISLRCGHNFCRSCIVNELDAQEAAGGYSFPDCKLQFPERPPLDKRRRLDNAADMEETRVFCTYCIKSPVPAVRSCLQCENSLCDDHLTAHNKSVDHILAEPASSFGNKKCSLHKKVLEYYCPQDAVCLCVSCCLVGEHHGHQVELLDEASEKKKRKQREYLEKLNPQTDEIHYKVQNLLNRQPATGSGGKESVERDLQAVSQISDQIKKLEIQEDELCRKMRDIEEMCRVTDPIRLLQETDITGCGDGDNGGKISSEEDQGELSDNQESEYDVEVVAEDTNEIPDDVDEVLISLTLYRFMRDITNKVTAQLRFQVPNLLLDVDTAERFLKISEDLKTAIDTGKLYERAKSLQRFLDYPQVLSRCSYTIGRHYWEVECNQIGRSDIGVSYPSIKKKGEESIIGENKKSWCLCFEDGFYFVIHNAEEKSLRSHSTSSAFGVLVDYEAGRLSFYELCDPIRHLHTTSFTEPLHAIFYVGNGASVTITS